ncbi:AfsR/SARP family transcriptional regulator [Plantactinospora veratri]
MDTLGRWQPDPSFRLIGGVMFEVSLLGPLEIISDGVPLVLGPPKQQVVLAMLALRPGRLVGMDELVDELWPAKPPASAVANARGYAGNLRRMFDRMPGVEVFSSDVDPDTSFDCRPRRWT